MSLEGILGILVLGILTLVGGLVQVIWEHAYDETPTADPEQIGAAVVMRHGSPFKLLVWCCFLVLGAIAIALVAEGIEDGDSWGITWYVVVPILFMSAALLAETWTHVRLDADGIHDFKPWRGHRTMAWKDVASVRHGIVNDWFIVRSREDRVIRFSSKLRGIEALRDRCRRHLEPAVFGGAFRGLEQRLER